MSDTIVLNGLAWDTKNLEVNGKTYFTYKEKPLYECLLQIWTFYC